MDQQKHIPSNDRGQSAIEFILTLSFSLGVTFLFVNLAINMTDGYLVHYVNFMSARTYLSYDAGVDNRESNRVEATREAKKTMESYSLSRFGINSTFEVFSHQQSSALFSGTVMQFQKALSSMPIIGGGDKVTLHSESFLGKEPYRVTCMEMTCASMTGSTNGCGANSNNMDIVLYDNGC